MGESFCFFLLEPACSTAEYSSSGRDVHTAEMKSSVLVVYVDYVVVVLTLTRIIIKSVVTGQAPVTLELRITPGKNTNNPRWYTHIYIYIYITADAIYASTRNI